MTEFDHFEIVVIPSKLCNLRCRYCYELPLLADRRRMSLDELRAMFDGLASYFATRERPAVVQFFWHGGEPLLWKPEYFWSAFELQRASFRGQPHVVRNVVQTNLTVLDDERIRLLRDGFDSAGVSVDLFSNLRVDKSGKNQEPRALENLARARSAGLELDGITVLTRPNAERMAEVYAFYRDRGMDFRLLPLHAGLYGSNQDFELKPAETLRALMLLVDLWLMDAAPIRIAPIHHVIERVIAAQRFRETTHLTYDKAKEEKLLIVDTDGTVSSYNDLFRAELAWGNIFKQPYAELLTSAGRQRALASAAARQSATCGRCRFFGKECDGFQIAEGESDFADFDAAGNKLCTVQQGLVTHVEQRLREAGVIRSDRRGLTDAFLASQRAEALRPQSYAY